MRVFCFCFAQKKGNVVSVTNSNCGVQRNLFGFYNSASIKTAVETGADLVSYCVVKSARIGIFVRWSVRI